MRLFRVVCVVLMTLVIVPRAEAQIGAIISILGGGYAAGRGQQERERMEMERRSMQQQLDADRAEQQELLKADRAQHKAALESKRIEDDRKAAEDARKADERADAVRSKRIQPATIEDLEVLYDPEDGWDISASPKIKPDRAQYIISGTITRHVSDAVLLCETVHEDGEFLGHYFTVRFSKKTKKARDILDRMRIGGPLFVVGKYIANLNYKTVAGAWKVMPIFEADHLVVPDGVD